MPRCDIYYECDRNAASTGFELDLGRHPLPNDTGLTITAIYPPPSPTYRGPMRLELEERLDMLVGKIRGVDPFTQDVTLRNRQLIGMKLRLSRPPEEEYEIELVDMNWFDFMAGVTPGRVPSYLFHFRPLGAATGALLCPLEADSETISREHHHAVVFRGDRYDPVTGRIRETDEPWLNIACAGTATAKLHLLRHTRAAKTSQYETTVPEREAMLRMLRADYCGNGTAYTVDGTPLRYADHKGWHTDGLDMTQPWQRKRVEALWNANGAVCLDKPRLVERDAIGCAVRRCGDLSDWKNEAHVVSANPAEGLDPPLNLP